jgi:hypothetical protein
MNSERCSDLSRAAGEALAATATRAERWLLVEVPGAWPRDVSAERVLPEPAHEAVAAWLDRTARSRLQFVRRPGRSAESPRAFVVRAEEDAVETRRIALSSHADLAEADLEEEGDPVEGSLLLVCGHGSRDTCCALHGTAVFAALAPRLAEEELWISSHQGGHRFAANVLVLPAALQFGRVEPDEAPFLAARALAGRIELDRYRGRTCYEPAVQAAERAVREAADLDGIGDLRLVGVEGAIVRFQAWDGTEHAAVVEAAEGPTVPASCGADPEPQTVWRARIV